MPHSEDVVVGDLLVTSGLAKRYPMGLPVARVTAVSHIAGSHFATVTAKPVAKLNQSRDVLLLSHQLTSEFLQTSEDSSASAESDQEL